MQQESNIAMGVTTKATEETEVQTLQVTTLDDEVIDDVPHIGQYGIASAVPKGAEAIVGFANGNRDTPLILSLGYNTERPTDLEESEVVLYSKNDNSVLLNKDGEVIITGKDNTSIKLNTSGEIVLNGGSGFVTEFNEMKIAFDTLVQNFNTHTHLYLAGPGTPPGTSIPTPIPTVPSTADMSGAKVEKVRT